MIISSTYAPLIANGDATGLDEIELGLFEAWAEDKGYPVVGDDVGFARCEVTGLFGECVEVESI